LPASIYVRAYSTANDNDLARKLRLQLLQADVDKAIAQAQQAQHEAEKVKKLGDAEVEKVKNEAEKVKKLGDAEADNVNDTRRRKTIGWGLFAGGILIFSSAISLDYFFHESDWYLKRRIRDKACCFDYPRLPASQYVERDLPHVIAGKPTMLVGPTGCGKTTIMRETLRKHVENNGQGLLLSIRCWDDCYNSGKSSSELLEYMLKCTGVPVQSSWLLRIWSYFQGEKVEVSVPGTGNTITVTVPRLRISRVQKVLSLVFDCAEEDFLASGGEKTWMLCFDEMQDLSRADRKFKFGGAELLQYLGSKIVLYSNDKKAVKILVAGSSYLLSSTFQRSPAGTDTRWLVRSVGDLSEVFVRNRLQALSYSAAEINKILHTFGTRGRLVEPFMSSQISDVDEHVDVAVGQVLLRITEVLSSCSPSERDTICKIAKALMSSVSYLPDVALDHTLIENVSGVFFFGPTGFQWQSVLAYRACLHSSLFSGPLSNMSAVEQGGNT
jgi:hypothetical protein